MIFNWHKNLVDIQDSTIVCCFGSNSHCITYCGQPINEQIRAQQNLCITISLSLWIWSSQYNALALIPTPQSQNWVGQLGKQIRRTGAFTPQQKFVRTSPKIDPGPIIFVNAVKYLRRINLTVCLQNYRILSTFLTCQDQFLL